MAKIVSSVPVKGSTPAAFVWLSGCETVFSTPAVPDVGAAVGDGAGVAPGRTPPVGGVGGVLGVTGGVLGVAGGVVGGVPGGVLGGVSDGVTAGVNGVQ